MGLGAQDEAFERRFALMFGGGTASLNVVREKRRKKKSDTDLSFLEEGTAPEEEEDGDEGIEIQVSLPRKKVKGLMMLSGGERALTSIALLFAISQVNPPPFIILDETDAALDEATRKKAYTEVQSVLACTGPIAHLAYGQLFTAVRSNVQGFDMLANRSLVGLKNASVAK